MKKVGGKMRPDGKVLKPEGWKPPQIEEILAKQPPLFDNKKV
jgi:predicted HAD superfamily Cof-like phosphohydrolase